MTREHAHRWHAAWDAALDAMELEADEVERMLRHRDALETVVQHPFEPPSDLGPLPIALADRARRLVQRQLDLSAELAVAISANRRQARITRMHNQTAASVPVFVDNRG